MPGDWYTARAVGLGFALLTATLTDVTPLPWFTLFTSQYWNVSPSPSEVGAVRVSVKAE